jgi:wyosine [tRNA(Phe)-imidazoG37] synthetase (radical SAM superfamily)
MSATVLTQNSRSFNTLRFAYPVVSRRSRGLSLGLNVNPDKVCNFDCPYCQVDRTTAGPDKTVDFHTMLTEIDTLMGMAKSGEIWEHPRFASTPAALRRLNDIAFAGDGEPTTYARLGDAIAEIHGLKTKHGMQTVKTIILTNATLLGSRTILDRLAQLKRGPYEIWAKLDAGTQPWFEAMSATKLKLERIVEGITACAREFEVIIQALIPTLDGKDPGNAEAEAIGERIAEISKAGGNLKLVQVYTTARRPSDSRIGMVEDARLDELAQAMRKRTTVPVEVYYGKQF